jgi:glutamate 5-kinase
MRKLPLKPKCIIIKIGSQLLVENGVLNAKFMRHIAHQIHELRQQGLQCILVSSGAIGCGRFALTKQTRALTLPEKQAAAAVGQSHLMHVYDKVFSRFDIIPAQILLTRDDLQERQRYLNARHTLNCLLKHNILPIINENDTVAVDEIKLGDNDILASLIAGVIHADMLVILSSVEGLLNADHQRISQVNIGDKKLWSLVRPDKTSLGTGGMGSKLTAAQTLSYMGKPTIVASGKTPNVLLKIVANKDIGTLFLPDPNQLKGKKHWLAFVGKTKGEISIDAGAMKALVERGTSLLASGITGVVSSFKKGDLVLISHNGKPIAKGLINYSADEVQQIAGKKTSLIAGILGYKNYDEVIHRDNLVLI